MREYSEEQKQVMKDCGMPEHFHVSDSNFKQIAEIKYRAGDTVKYRSKDSYSHQIHEGDLCKVTRIEPGIFDHPYTSVEFNGKTFCAFAYRFQPLDTPDKEDV